MQELLFLAHRIPYPPNKGDKIRSFHMLKHLAQRYRVHVGAFVDTPDDWQHVSELRALCGGEVGLIGLNPARRRLHSLRGLATGEPLTLPYYRTRAMQQWVKRILRERPIRSGFVFSSGMAPYLADESDLSRRVLDFVDVDSDKWKQYAQSHRWPASWIYRREARKLLAAERHYAQVYDFSLFVSAAEVRLFLEYAPESRERVRAVENGVDTEYFSPRQVFASPYPVSAAVLVFVGAMDYWANVDAVTWFAQAVFPRVRAQVPDAKFYIVGARPTREVLRLAVEPGIHVTGAVPDVRPYLAHARAAVAPLRVARGVQNKVLEAMAMARPIVATPQAMDGLNGWEALRPLVSERPEELARAACACLTATEAAEYGARGRACVTAHYSWSANLARLDEVLDGASPVGAVA